MKNWHRSPWLVLALAGLFFFPGLGARDLWNPDEPRYAEVAREMTTTGEYFVPHLNGEIYAHKPPLQFWAIAAAGKLTGKLDERAVRLPAALAAVGATVLTFLLGLRLFGPRAAWIAAVAFATASRIPWQARTGQIDGLLVFLVVLAVYCWVRGESEERPGWILAFYAVSGVATIAKGPAGFLPPLLAILAYHAWRRDRSGLRRLMIGRGLLIWVSVVIAWLGPATIIAGPEYFEEVTIGQNLQRYLATGSPTDTSGHLRPFYYFLLSVPGDFFPWTVLLPTALVWAIRRSRGETRRWLFFLGCWVLVTILFFSFSPSKRTVYVLTMFPGLALLLGAGLDRYASRGTGTAAPGLVWPSIVLSMLGGLAVAVLPSQLDRIEGLNRVSAQVPRLLLIGLVLFTLGMAVSWLFARRGNLPGQIGAVAIGMGALVWILFHQILPQFDVIKSMRPMAQTVRETLAPVDTYCMYPKLEPAILFYSERFSARTCHEEHESTDTGEKLASYLADPVNDYLLIASRKLSAIPESAQLTEVARETGTRDEFVLYRLDDS
jgi:4-amino-4-deoxy-L-arabinose transferase-like glycosyltransferase